MKYYTSLIIAALVVLVSDGCAKHSPPKVTDLGVVEVSEGIPIHRDLSGRSGCIIIPTSIQGGSVTLSITIEATNSTGVVTTSECPKVRSIAGQQVEVRTPDADIRLTPQIKS